MAAQQKGGHSHWGARSSSGQRRHRRVRLCKESWAFLLRAFIVMSCDLAFKNKRVLTPVTLIPMGEISYDYVYIYICTNIYLSSPAFESLHVIQVGRCDTWRAGLRKWWCERGLATESLTLETRLPQCFASEFDMDFFGCKADHPAHWLVRKPFLLPSYTVLVLSTYQLSTKWMAAWDRLGLHDLLGTVYFKDAYGWIHVSFKATL